MIAFVSDLEVARAAYQAAVKAKPGKRITLRQRARVIERSFDSLAPVTPHNVRRDESNRNRKGHQGLATARNNP